MVVNLEHRVLIPSEQGGKGDQRIDTKQEIRRVFADQLSRVWRDSPQLSKWLRVGFVPARADQHGLNESSDLITPFFYVETCGYEAVPLVSWANGLSCDIEIILTGEERSAIRGGDLDNRLKVLFDALRMPHNSKEVPGNMWGKNKERLFCLLEDDSLIRKFSVEAKQSPYSPAENRVEVTANIVTRDGSHALLQRFR